MARFTISGLGAFASLITYSLADCTVNAVPTPTNFYGPLSSVTFADPSIFQDSSVDGTYYVYATNDHSNNDNQNVNVPFAFTSTSISSSIGTWSEYNTTCTNCALCPCNQRWDAMLGKAFGGYGVGAWTFGGYVDNTNTPLEETDPNYNADLWSPDVSKIPGGNYIIYYSARSRIKNSTGVFQGQRCIGLGTAPSPMGPFKPQQSAFYCPPQGGGAIAADGYLNHNNNKRYVVFKSPSSPGGGGPDPSMLMFQVNYTTGDNLDSSPDPTTITTSIAAYPGEESAALTRMPDNRFLLLHTEGVYNQSYQVVYAVSNGSSDAYINTFYTDYHNKTGRILINDKSIDGTSQYYSPGGPDFIGANNSEFIFAARLKSDTSARLLFYANMVYC